jgi:hypothetical protein
VQNRQGAPRAKGGKHRRRQQCLRPASAGLSFIHTIFRDVLVALFLAALVAEQYHKQQEEEEQAGAIFKQFAVAEDDDQQQEEEEQAVTFSANATPKQTIEETHG